MVSQWIEINRMQLRYAHEKCAGKATRGTLVMVHEMGGAIETFDAIMPEMTKHWDVLRYDQRGSGLSEKTRGALDVDTLADDLAGLIHALDIQTPIAVLACALGAAVAVRFAAKNPAVPSSLVLMSPATATPGDRRDWLLQRADTIEEQGLRTVLDIKEGQSLDRHEVLRLVSDPASLASYWRMLVDLDLDGSLAALSCPVLVLAGERDKVRHPARVEEEVVSKIRNVTFQAVDSGHVMPVETPELTARLLTDYLTKQGL